MSLYYLLNMLDMVIDLNPCWNFLLILFYTYELLVQIFIGGISQTLSSNGHLKAYHHEILEDIEEQYAFLEVIGHFMLQCYNFFNKNVFY